jgi:membrane-associated phospholipid phosphatase
MMLLVLVSIVSFIFFKKDELFWTLNHRHSVPGDYFFKYITYLGDGWAMIIAADLIITFGKKKLGVMMILAFILSSLLAQTIKNVNQTPRPAIYFKAVKQDHLIHRVDGHLNQNNRSFPSGHTTTAFAMFSLLAFDNRRLRWQILFFLLALAVGYSRIYLGHHFFEDVFVGASLGFLSSFFFIWMMKDKDF